MENEMKNNRISFTALLVAIFFAITPIHQMLLLSNGSTINKYLSILIVVFIFVKQSLDHGNISVQTQINQETVGIIVYVVISILWAISRQVAINSSVSIVEYIVFTLLICSVTWSDKEKKLFLLAIVISCTFFSFTLTSNLSDSRSILSGINEETTDPNMLAANLAVGVIISIRSYLVSKRAIIRWGSFICVFVIMYGIIATGSRGGLIACIVGIIYVLRKNDISAKQFIRILFAITIIVIGSVLVLSDKTSLSDAVIDRFVRQELVEGGNGRIFIWGQYLSMLFGQVYSLLIGNGYGNSGIGYSEYYQTQWPPATHNDLIGLLCEGGLILVIMVFLLVKKTWQISKGQRNIIGNAALIIALVSGLTLNCFNKYIWWNCIILAYIGVDCFDNTEEEHGREGVADFAHNR